MARINLLGGTYQAKSVIADAQRCINLYPEANPGDDQDHPVTHYLTPGTVLLTQPPIPGKARCEYRASNGNYYRVVGNNVYAVSSTWAHTYLGSIAPGTSICYMSDNGLVVVLVDGTLTAYAINLTSITGIASLSVHAPGANYTDGTYTEVPLIGGTGNGALGTIYISGGVVFAASIDYAGQGYTVGDILTFSTANVGNTGSNGQLAVSALVGYQFAPITTPDYLGATKVDYLDTFFMFNVPNTNEWYITLGEPDYAVLTGTPGGVLTGALTSGGTGYNNGTYTGVVLTGGSGSGAIATIVIAGGKVTVVQITVGGENYLIGDSLGFNASDYSGIGTTTVSAPGSGYTNGTYTSVPLTGGSGSGAIATIVVSGGAVATVTLTTLGMMYIVGDILSASNSSLGGAGSGFQLTVNTLNGSGFDFNVGTVAGAGFDPTDIASKTGSPDPIVTIAVVHTEIWLIGQLTTEVWYNAGAATFTFQRLPGTFVEHGCAAAYSIARNDLSLFWLSQDRQGQTIVVMSSGYTLVRISTHAIENALGTYSTIADACGYTYQQEGHVFYVLTFPTANVTWVYDVTIGLWHQRAVTDANGYLNQVRGQVSAFVFGTNIVGDSTTGNLYAMRLGIATDYVDGNGPNSDGSYPISRIRAFPHLVDDFDRVSYRNFIADMEAGNDAGTLDSSTPSNPPMVSLKWSDNRGKSYGNAVGQSLGAGGQYLTTLQWNRLGYARDRVFELSWSAPTQTALQGAFIEVVKEAT